MMKTATSKHVMFAGPGPSMLLLCSGLLWDSHHLGLTPEAI